MTAPTLTDTARRIAAQLDARGNPDLTGLPETLCRALKVQEEAGEMAQAVIGVLGQNPRKGVTHSWDEVVAEAIDVALSALVFAETVQPGRLNLTVAGRLEFLRRRAAASGAPDIEATVDTVTVEGNPGDQRHAATLRWLLDAHTEYGLPLPRDITTYASGVHLGLRDDEADGVQRWAALLGAPVERDERSYNGKQWTRVRAETLYGTDAAGLGWKYIEVTSNCDRRLVTESAPVAVAA